MKLTENKISKVEPEGEVITTTYVKSHKNIVRDILKGEPKQIKMYLKFLRENINLFKNDEANVRESIPLDVFIENLKDFREKLNSHINKLLNGLEEHKKYYGEYLTHNFMLGF